MKLTHIIGLALFVLALAVSVPSWANGDTYITEITNVDVDYDSGGILTAVGVAAAQINPNHNTSNWQTSIGFGSYQGENAWAIGVAKVIDNNLLVNFTMIGAEDNVSHSVTQTAYGVGFNWTWP